MGLRSRAALVLGAVSVLNVVGATPAAALAGCLDSVTCNPQNVIMLAEAEAGGSAAAAAISGNVVAGNTATAAVGAITPTAGAAGAAAGTVTPYLGVHGPMATAGVVGAAASLYGLYSLQTTPNPAVVNPGAAGQPGWDPSSVGVTYYRYFDGAVQEQQANVILEVLSAPEFGEAGQIVIRRSLESPLTLGSDGKATTGTIGIGWHTWDDDHSNPQGSPGPGSGVTFSEQLTTKTVTYDMPANWSHISISTYPAYGGPQVVYSWYPQGHPERPEDASGQVRAVSRIWCGRAGAQDVVQEQRSDWGPVTGPLILPDNECPVGYVQKAYEILYEDMNGQSWTVVAKTNLSVGGYMAHEADFNECLSSRDCTLRLQRQLSDGSTVECLTSGGWNTLCNSWAADPDREALYTCRYGSVLLGLEACQAYADMPERLRATAPQTGGELDTGGDPVVVAPPALATPEQEQEAAKPRSECFPRGWSAFNPVEWVEKPVTCALRAAFQPSPAVVDTEVSGMRDRWQTSRVVQAANGLGGIAQAVGGLAEGNDGCEGPTFDMSFPGVDGTFTFEPLNACKQPMSTIAAITKPVVAVAVVITGTLLFVNTVLNPFGMRLYRKAQDDS